MSIYDALYNTSLKERILQLGDNIPIIAGYCAVPDRERTIEMAKELSQLPYVIAQRGGAYKPRTHADSFQGYGEEGLEWLKEAYDLTQLPVVTEITDASQLEPLKKFFGDKLDGVVIQIGSRNMQNYELLKRVNEETGKTPVLLKRGLAATEGEVKGSISYLGERPILLCLRGLQWPPHDESLRLAAQQLPYQLEGSRYWIDVGHIPIFRNYFSNSIIVGYDPSHPAGRAELVGPISVNAVRLGARFLMIETMLDTDDRSKLLCDGPQAVSISELLKLQNIINHDKQKNLQSL